MHLFLINLDRDKDRLAAADGQLARYGVSYERIPAVYGKSVSAAERGTAVNRFRWWCAVGRPMTDGELGCALSHAAIYRKMIAENIPVACVMEDDVVLDARFPAVLRIVEERFPQDSNAVWLLSNHTDGVGLLGDRDAGYVSPPESGGFSLRPSAGDLFAECYVLGIGAAKALLRANAPIVTPCDWWGRWARLGVIGLYHVFPVVARQEKTVFSSHTAQGLCRPVRDMSLPRFCWHKFNRLIGKSIDVVLTRI